MTSAARLVRQPLRTKVPHGSRGSTRRLVMKWLVVLVYIHAATGVQYGTNNYTEYWPGTLNLILGSPHGGSLKPATIRDRRSAGCYNSSSKECVWTHDCARMDSSQCSAATEVDSYTQDLALEIADAIEVIYGKGRRPHVILNNLHRIKLDANRELNEATFGDPIAGQAYLDYQSFIETAKAAVGYKGLFIDVHGQSISNNATQIGVLLGSSVLNAKNIPDNLYQSTSIRNMYLKSGLSLEQMVRGPQSFGGQLSAKGYKVIPSPTLPGPQSYTWYSGGYNTWRHSTGFMDAIQIEAHWSCRTPAKIRRRFAADCASIIASFLNSYF